MMLCPHHDSYDCCNDDHNCGETKRYLDTCLQGKCQFTNVNLSTIARRVDGHDLNHKHVIRLIHCSAFQHAQTHAGCAKGRSHTKNANNNMVLTAKDLVHTNTTTTTLHGCVLIAAETNPTHLNMQLEHNMA